jgi:hypothetical protein
MQARGATGLTWIRRQERLLRLAQNIEGNPPKIREPTGLSGLRERSMTSPSLSASFDLTTYQLQR